MNELEKPKSKYELRFILPDDWGNNHYEQKVIRSILTHLYERKVTQATFTKAQITKLYNQDNIVSPDAPIQGNLRYINQLEIISKKMIGITYEMHKNRKRWIGVLINAVCIDKETGSLEVFMNHRIVNEFLELPLKSPNGKKVLLNESRNMVTKTLA